MKRELGIGVVDGVRRCVCGCVDVKLQRGTYVAVHFAHAHFAQSEKAEGAK